MSKLRGDSMARVGKDDFVNGFVPHHNHGSVDYTSVESGHVHQCLDVTSHPFRRKTTIIFIIRKDMLFLKMGIPTIIKLILDQQSQ
jgi:hypothetical protein